MHNPRIKTHKRLTAIETIDPHGSGGRGLRNTPLSHMQSHHRQCHYNYRSRMHRPRTKLVDGVLVGLIVGTNVGGDGKAV